MFSRGSRARTDVVEILTGDGGYEKYAIRFPDEVLYELLSVYDKFFYLPDRI